MKSKDNELEITGISTCENLGISFEEGKRLLGSMFERIIAAIENAENSLESISSDE